MAEKPLNELQGKVVTPLGRVMPVMRGEYDPAETYAPPDIVLFDGSSWSPVHEVSGVTPEAGDDWVLVAQKGDQGEVIGAVASFNGRDGEVLPEAGDYAVADITGLEDALGEKQDALAFDQTPTESSANPVTSGGVYDALKNTVVSFNGRQGAVMPKAGDYKAADITGAVRSIDTTYTPDANGNIKYGVFTNNTTFEISVRASVHFSSTSRGTSATFIVPGVYPYTNTMPTVTYTVSSAAGLQAWFYDGTGSSYSNTEVSVIPEHTRCYNHTLMVQFHIDNLVAQTKPFTPGIGLIQTWLTFNITFASAANLTKEEEKQMIQDSISKERMTDDDHD